MMGLLTSRNRGQNTEMVLGTLTENIGEVNMYIDTSDHIYDTP